MKDCGEDAHTGITWRRYHCPDHPKIEFEPTYEIPQKQIAELAGALRSANLFAKHFLEIPLYRK